MKFSKEVMDAIPSCDAVDPMLRSQCALVQMDAPQTLAFARQLETISSRVFSIQYPALKAMSLLPMNNEANAADEFFTTRVWDRFVMAKIVSNYSTDIPTVSGSAREVTARFFTVADSYKFSVDDLRAAERAGIPLQSRDAEAARFGIELAREQIAATGEPSLGVFGLANQPNVTIATLPNGDWANVATTGEEILEDLNYLVDQIVLGTNEVLSPDTVVLPVSLYRLAARKLMSINGLATGSSILTVFAQQNPGITVVSWDKLATAAADGGARIMAYKRDPSVVEFLNAVTLETMPTEYHAMTWTTVLRSKVGGVALYQPRGVVYADNAA